MKTRRDVSRKQEQCVVCLRWFYSRFQLDPYEPPICSWACYIEHQWRASLHTQGMDYYPNPRTHDKLGRKIIGGIL